MLAPIFGVKLMEMHSKATIDDYRRRINIVLSYIDKNLDEKLDLETLSAVSHFSPYHFHRIMKAYLNEPLGSYIIRIRLENAATLLSYTDLPLNEIAYKIGYDTPSSFTKAFKSRFGLSPRSYRNNNGSIRIMKDHTLSNQKLEKMEISGEIKTIEPRKIIYVQAIGAYKDVGPTWEKLCSWAGKKGLFGKENEFIGISHDDPHITETEKLRYDACLTVRQDVKPEGEIGVKIIEGGKYATFIHKGPYSNLQKTYDAIYKQWMVESGTQFRDLPCFEKYLNSPEDTKPEHLLTEIYIPVQ